MKSNKEEPKIPLPESGKVSPLNIAISILLAPLSSFLLVFIFTNAVDFIAQEQWAGTPIIWPPLLYLGAIIGGIIGGLIAFWDLRQSITKNTAFNLAQIFAPDLFYLGLLVLLTYVLGWFSESLILQIILFILEIAWFTVIGRNIAILFLTHPTSTKNSTIPTENSDH